MMERNTFKVAYIPPATRIILFNESDVMQVNIGVDWSHPKSVGDAKQVYYMDEDEENEPFSLRKTKSIWDEEAE